MGILASMGKLLSFILEIYSWMIIARALLSWVSPDPYNPIMQFLIRFTDPLLRPMRRIVPVIGGMDLSPILALVAIWAVQRVVLVLFQSGDLAAGLILLLIEALSLIHLLLTLFLLLLMVRAGINLYAWFSFRQGRYAKIDMYNPAIRFIYQATDPLIRPLRLRLPTVYSLDVSPLVAIGVIVAVLFVLQEGVMLLAQPVSLHLIP